MLDKTKNIVVVFSFMTLLILVFILNLFKEDVEVSLVERRKLAKFPNITFKNILNGSFSKEFENYVTDQIIERENFRKLKTNIELKIFKKRDNNDIYLYNDKLIKIEYPLNEKSILNATNKINEIKAKYLKNNENCYYSIIPDKNYFTNKNEYISMDYDKLQNIMLQNIEDIKYINIFDCLKLEDYYITDIHWKQENLSKVVDTLSTKMNFKDRLTAPYNLEKVIEFDGIYANQLLLNIPKDIIYTLTNEKIDNAVVYQYENQKYSKIYDETKLNSNDKYDIYLSGASPLLTITNPNSTLEKELIVFRDSFASSLIPLFTEAYSKIILVDIRYMRSRDLEKFIEFNSNQDVLFLYSSIVLNNSGVLR